MRLFIKYLVRKIGVQKLGLLTLKYLVQRLKKSKSAADWQRLKAELHHFRCQVDVFDDALDNDIISKREWQKMAALTEKLGAEIA